MSVSSATLSPAQRMLALKALPGFDGVPPGKLIEMGVHTDSVAFAAGESIVTAGTRSDHIFIVIEGGARGRAHGKDLFVAGPQELVGGPGVLTDAPYPIDAVATEASRLLRIRRSVLWAVLGESFPVYAAMLRAVAAELADGHPAPRGNLVPLPLRVDPEDTATTLALLAECDDLAALPLDALAAIATDVELRQLDAGPLWQSGDREDYAAIPLSGRWFATSGSDNDTSERPSSIFGWTLREPEDEPSPPGAEARPIRLRCLLGFEEAIAGIPRRYSVTVQTPGTMLAIRRGTVMDELEDDDRAARALLTQLASRAASRFLAGRAEDGPTNEA